MQIPAQGQAATEMAQAKAEIQAQAQQMRDQAQAMKEQAQAMRDAARSGVLVPPNDLARQQMDYQHHREQERMVFAGFLIIIIASVLVLSPIARAFGRRLDRSRPGKEKGLDGSADQLQRMEQAIDAMAIEIERISEGQRFTTRLLSGREGVAVPLSSREDAGKSRPA